MKKRIRKYFQNFLGITALKNEVLRLNKENVSLKGNLNSFEGALRQHKSKIDNLNKTLRQHNSRMNSISKKIKR